MNQAKIGGQEFAELLLAELPQLRDELQECRGLKHLEMMEFALFTERACKRRDWKTVEKCLRLAEKLLRLKDSEVNNAVHVSFLEILPRKGKVHDRLKMIMTTDLRKAWDEILAYLSKVSRT
jgi:hypothetical protein